MSDSSVSTPAGTGAHPSGPPRHAGGEVGHPGDGAGPGERTPRVVAVADVAADHRRGGQLRVLLGPRTVGSTSGFMGVVHLAAGERIAEHYHPYSEEFLYVASGAIEVDLDGRATPVATGQAVYVPQYVRHRLRNPGPAPAEVVFHLGPLAPRPELGHVDTEQAAAAPAGTGAQTGAGAGGAEAGP